jgi:signal transduction histidine kinase
MSETRTIKRASRPVPEVEFPVLQQLRRLAAKLGGGVGADVVDAAYERAVAAAQATERPAGRRLAQCRFLAEVLGAAVAEQPVTREELAEPLALIAGDGGSLDAETARALVFSFAVGDPRLVVLPPENAVGAALRLLFLFAPVDEVSFWVWRPDDPVHVVAQVGGRPPTRATQAAARRAIFGRNGSTGGRQAFIQALPVTNGDSIGGALVVRARPQQMPHALRLATELEPTLAAILGRDRLLERTAAGGRSIIEAGERRLRRVGLDLHDGPLQELARFHGDMKLLRHRLIATGLTQELMPVARDLDALLTFAASLEASLRETSRSLGMPPYIRESLKDALSHETRAVEAAGIRCHLRISGDLDTLTQSQRIAVVRILQEALANIRLHSGANDVRASVHVTDGHAALEVVDNGRGLDAERVLRRAAHRGRLGLIGMRERARLLDGTFSLTSAPGGPTRLAVTLPAWRPLVPGDPEPAPAD